MDASFRPERVGEGGAQTLALPSSLLRLLLGRLEHLWHGSSKLRPSYEDDLVGALYKTKGYLRRRAPNEIEAVLTTIDDNALGMISQSFTSPLGLLPFAEAIVKTGTYDADHVLAFVGGVIDLFLEVLWSQAENAREDQEPRTVNWCQLMNHFIESPEIAMYESNEVSTGLAAKTAAALDKQIARNSFMDRAKHMGASIQKLYWIAHLEMMVTVEGTESIYFWSPTVSWDEPKKVTPELPPETYYNKTGGALFDVLAIDWDPELQDLAAILSNRMLIVWRLRNKEKGQFQQKKEFRFDAKRGEARGDKEPEWKVFLNILDPKTFENLHEKKRPEEIEEKGEAAMRRELREQRLADEASAQLDIWWNGHLQQWVTTNSKGRLFFWDLRKTEGAWLEATVQPTRRLTAHTKLVTSHLELSKFKFTTCSLDRSVVLWDNRNLSTPEVKIQEHTGSVLSQAYLPLYNMLVSVGCEKTVYCWTIDSIAFRGVRKKLSGHQSNLLQATAGSSVFFTLDEAFVMIVWDALAIVQIQTVSCKDFAPKHVKVLPHLGRVCLAGRRLNFYEGNEHAAIAIGAAPTKDFERNKSKQEEGASLKDRAPVKWCGLASHRGTMISVTEAEVRLHTRGQPGQFRAIFNTPEGDAISDVAVADGLALLVLGTQKGAIHFLKYRSGCTLKMYPGRTDDLGGRWQPGAGGGKAKPVDDGEHEAGADGEPAARVNRNRFNSAASGDPDAARTKSPAAGSRSPLGKASAATSPLGAARGVTASAADGGEGVPSEDDGPAQEHREAKGAARGGPLLANAPSPEEILSGMSRKIKCVLPCEGERRVYVGTTEGQVIMFRVDSRREFPVERWATCPDASSADPHLPARDPPAVTCLQCAPRACVATGSEEEAGLLIVGTQDGAVHLYDMDNLKLAGSINIPRALQAEEDAPQRMARICHLRLFNIRTEPELPLTLMTVDARSQIRFWGFNIHVQEWKLQALKLLLDAGHLCECHCVGGPGAPPRGSSLAARDVAGAKAKSAARRSSKATGSLKSTGKADKDGAAAGRGDGAAGEAATGAGGRGSEAHAGSGASGGQQATGAVVQVATRSVSSEPVRITAVATLTGRLAPPTKALRKQPRDGPAAANRAQAKPKKGEIQRMGMEANGKPIPDDNAQQQQPGLGSTVPSASAFMTQPPGSSTGPRTPKAADGLHVSFREDQMIQEGYREASGSETEGDEDELVGRRLFDRPRSPPRLVEASPGATEEEKAEADRKNYLAQAAAMSEQKAEGADLVFFADSGGWIWCIDIAASIADALEKSPAISVNLDAAWRTKEDPRRIRSSLSDGPRVPTRGTLRPAESRLSGSSLLGGATASKADEPSLMMSRGPIKPRPEAMKVVGAWPAHPEEIVSLAPAGAPPALVSTDVSKEVKVWSTAGDLWGHFSMLGIEGVPPVVAVWPPPHVLATQIALMRAAKGLCKKMGFATRRKGDKQSQKLSRQMRRSNSKQLRSMTRSTNEVRKTASMLLQGAERSQASTAPPAHLRATGGGLAVTDATSRSASKARRSVASSRSGRSRAASGCGSDEYSSSATDSADGGSDEVEVAALKAVLFQAVSQGDKRAAGPAAGAQAEAAEEAATPARTATPRSHGGGSAASDAGATQSQAGEGRRKRKVFTNGQLSEMIRHHAFSSGCQSYKQFRRKAERSGMEMSMRSRLGSTSQLEAHRSSFAGRPPSAFGVELFSHQDEEAWENCVRGLGKSASEGALLRYAHSAVEKETNWVRKTLGVDVSKVSRKQIRRPSFLERLDNWPVSADPSSPASATAQAVRKLCSPEAGQRSAAILTPPLVNAGQMTVGQRNRQSRAV